MQDDILVQRIAVDAMVSESRLQLVNIVKE